MQFPWREYVWLVILLALAIGLAVEQQRVRKFTACRDQVTSQQRVAQELADHICSLTNTTTQFTEFQDIYFWDKTPAQSLANKVWIGDWKRTDESAGLGWSARTDLGFSLFVMLTFVLGALLTAFRLGGDYKPGDRSWRDTLLFRGTFQILGLAIASILLYGSIWIFATAGSKPLTASVCLATGVVLLNRYVYLGGLSRDELENLALRIGGRMLDLTELRARFRLQLRDFFWLMLVIGLACAVYVENQRARDLSKHLGRAQWWDSAAASLRFEKGRLRTLFPYVNSLP